MGKDFKYLHNALLRNTRKLKYIFVFPKTIRAQRVNEVDIHVHVRRLRLFSSKNKVLASDIPSNSGIILYVTSYKCLSLAGCICKMILGNSLYCVCSCVCQGSQQRNPWNSVLLILCVEKPLKRWFLSTENNDIEMSPMGQHHNVEMELLSTLLALCEGINLWFLLTKGPVVQGIEVYFAVWLSKLLNKQLSCQWIMVPWCFCDIALMIF